ncbi:MAG: hypothetical protein ACYC4R_12210 [Anaerolineae bacterium]
MSDTSSHPAAEENVPAGYRQVLYFRIGEKWWRGALLLLLGVLSLFPWWAFFGWFGRTIGHIQPSGSLSGLQLGLVLIGTPLVVLFLHELAHALAMRVLGTRPRFGIL